MKIVKNIILILGDLIIAGLVVLGIYIYVYQIPSKLDSLNVNLNNGVQIINRVSNTNWNDKFKDKFSNNVEITDSSYRSKDISITIEKRTKGEGSNLVTYFVADIYIANIRNLQTGFAKDTYGVGYKEDLVSLAKRNKAILAINGDSYSNNHNRDNGTIIRNGILYRNEPTTSDILVLYNDGTMATYNQDDIDYKSLKQDGIYQTWLFGPSLLDENGHAKRDFNVRGYLKKAHPRTAIGYIEPGHYIFTLVDGRQDGYSRGMYLDELAMVFEEMGCKVAYNLDGGHSSFMTLENQIYNQPYKISNDISDAIFIKELE